jgi:hypothetical protein
MFEPGSWDAAAGAQRATIKLTRGGRVVASGSRVVRDGRARIRLRTRRPLRAGVYKLRIKAGTRTFTQKVRIRSSSLRH